MASSTASRTTSATRSRTPSASASMGSSTVQFAPVDGLTLTARYTFAQQQADRRSRRADHLAAAQWLRPHRVRYRPGGRDAGAAARVHRREQGLRLRAAASRAEERPEFGRLQCELGHRRQLQSAARLSRFRAPAACRTMPITGGGETSFSLAGKVPSTGNCARRRPDGLHELLDPDVPVQQWSADRRAHAVPDEPGGLRQHRRKLRLQLRHVKPRFADPAHQLPRAEHRDQADALRRQVQVRKRKHAGLRRGDSRHGDARSCPPARTSPWATGVWATLARCRTWSRC